MVRFVNKNFVILSFIAVFFCFIPLFYFSTKFIINGWAYSDALINYSEGFIRRGFLGEIILSIHKLTDIQPSKVHSYIFIFITCINIILYVLILKNISKSRFVYIFLLFNPALLFFPLNDTGGYLRKELIVLTLMLFHCYICSNFHNRKIDTTKYFRLLYTIIIPGIIIITLMHDIQLFLIPFHFLLSMNIINNNLNLFNFRNYLNKKHLILVPYLITILPIIVFIFYPIKLEKIELLAENVWLIDPEVSWWPIYHTTNSFLNIVVNETNFMFSADEFGTYNHLANYFFLFIISISSIYFIFNYIFKNNIKIYNHFFIFFSTLPIFLLFFIGRDWGRWLSMLSWTCLLFYLQFNIKIENNYFAIFKNKILNIFSIIICCYFLFFISVPHCCKATNIFGGFSDNISLIYKIIFKQSKHIKNTFRRI